MTELLNKNNYLDIYLSEIGNYSQLSDDDEKRLSEIIMRTKSDVNNDEFINARNELVLHNLKLVVYFAKKYYNSRFNLDELIQVGNIGLMRAASNFDYTKAKFSTHASYYIVSSITDHFNSYNFSYYLPRRLSELVFWIDKLKKQYECYGYTDDEIKELIMKERNITNEQYEEADNAKYTIYPISLNNSSFNADGDLEKELVDILNIGTNQVEQDVDYILLNDTIQRNLLELLDESDYKIIVERFGLYNNKPMTLAEIGNKMGMSPETIRQHELKSIEKLRLSLKDFSYLA